MWHLWGPLSSTLINDKDFGVLAKSGSQYCFFLCVQFFF